MIAISKENMRIHLHANDWKDALIEACSLLVENGSITNDYIDDIIQSVLDNGPYIVIMPGFALAHAKPSEHVLKTDLALAVFDEDIEFYSVNDPVRLIITIASPDPQSHLDRLAKIASKMIDDPTLINRIIQSNSIDEISSWIND